ncbi:transposase [Chloroflexota bacterium]
MEENGIEAKLSHPLKTRTIAAARVKNDKIDPKILAHLLRADLLPLSYVPDRDVRMQRQLLRYHASLVKTQTGMKNRIDSILAEHNISHGFGDLFGKQGNDFLRRLPIPVIYRMVLDGYLSVLDELEKQIKLANIQIAAIVKDDEEAGLLMTIPGI